MAQRRKKKVSTKKSCSACGPFNFAISPKGGVVRTCRVCGTAVRESTDRTTSDLAAQTKKTAMHHGHGRT